MSTPKFLSNASKIFKGAVSAESIRQFDGPITVSSGSLMLDWAIGGGFPIGNITSIAGPSGSFKSGFAIMASAKLQSQDPESIVVIKDTEMFYHDNPVAMRRLEAMGLDLKRTFIQSSNNAEEICGNLDAEKKAILSGEVKVAAYIIDSLSGIQDPYALKKMSEGDIDAMANGKVGGAGTKLNGSIMKGLLAFVADCKDSRVSFFIIQHVYEELDQYKKLSDPFVVTGGQAVRYLVRCRIMLESIKKKGSVIGLDGKTSDKTESEATMGKIIRCRVLKTGQCMEGRKVDFFMDLVNMKEVRQGEALRDLALNLGVIKKLNNVTFEYNGTKFRGKDEVAVQIDKNPEMKQSIYEDCLKSAVIPTDAQLNSEDDEVEVLS